MRRQKQPARHKRILIVLVGLAVAAQPASASTPACEQRSGEKVLARTNEALVVERPNRGVYGCLLDSGRRHRLDEPGSDIDEPADVVGRPTLSGNPLTRTVNTCPVRTCPRRDAASEPNVKDEGTAIDPRSLTLRRSRLSWTKDGRRQIARL
jgi:hypothetical protein